MPEDGRRKTEDGKIGKLTLFNMKIWDLGFQSNLKGQVPAELGVSWYHGRASSGRSWGFMVTWKSKFRQNLGFHGNMEGQVSAELGVSW